MNPEIHSPTIQTLTLVRQTIVSLLVLSAAVLLPHLARAGFVPAGDLIMPRYYHTATLLQDGRVLVAGGVIDGSAYVTNTAEIYDPATNAWSATGSMNVARGFHSAVLLPDGKVLVTGGVV